MYVYIYVYRGSKLETKAIAPTQTYRVIFSRGVKKFCGLISVARVWEITSLRKVAICHRRLGRVIAHFQIVTMTIRSLKCDVILNNY